MKPIRILEVDQNQETVPLQANTQGVWVRFTSRDVEGWATFMHGKSSSDSDLEGRDFFVETSYEKMQSLARVDEAVLESIEPLSTAGDFLIHATVKVASDDGVVYCSAGEFNFMINVPIDDRPLFAPGARITMEVIGLILWDVNA